MNEGPAPNDPYQTSPTIVAVKQAFDDRSKADKKAEFRNIVYPTTTRWDIANPVINRTITGDVQEGAANLHKEIRSITASSPCATFSLVGYSEGAWAIGYWLWASAYRNDTKSVKDIALLGDPWWYQDHGRDSHGRRIVSMGLARRFGLALLGPPWPAQNTPYLVMSLCNNSDPICGEGYANTPATQIAAALTIGGIDSPHLHYKDNGAAKYAGEFLADHA